MFDLVQDGTHVVSDTTFTPVRSALLCAAPAVSTEFDILIDQVYLLHFGALFPGRSENYIGHLIDNPVFPVAAHNRSYSRRVTSGF